MTQSPLRLAETALAAARQTLPLYASKFSRQDFTQHPLFALLVLREFLKQDYRGLEQLLRDGSDRRQALSLAKVPDHSTLQKAAPRLLEKKRLCRASRAIPAESATVLTAPRPTPPPRGGPSG